MPILPLDAAFELGKTVIERIWPNPKDQADQLFRLTELKAKGDSEELNAHVQLMLAQIKVNEAEANHKSVFVAGGRPFIIWVGGFSLAYTFLIHPFFCWLLVVAHGLKSIPETVIAPPIPDAGPLFALVTGLLGIGAMRSFDKKEGTQTDAIRPRDISGQVIK